VRSTLLCVGALASVAVLQVEAAEAASGEWASYGADLANTRSQQRPERVGSGTAPRLRERWALRRVGSVNGTTHSVTSTPAVAGGVVYYTDWTGRLTAVDLSTGRVRWSTKVSVAEMSQASAVMSSPAVAGDTVYTSALEGRVVAVAVDSGAIRWSKLLATHGLTTLHSSPTVSGDRLIVGVASAQNFFSPGPYDFRGSVVALDTRTGRMLWQKYTMPKGKDGTGGSVWGTAAIDERRGIAYVGTGQAYSGNPGRLTDALLAVRLRDGSLAWHRQFTRDDVWNAFEGVGGKDHDVGASPNLFRIGRRDVVGVGDKGGRYATLDRASGATVWRRALCPGTHLGGIMTTAAVADGSIWVACNTPAPATLDPNGGDPLAPYFDTPIHRPPSYTDVFRLSAGTGRTLWRRRVSGITFGALTEAGGAVFVPNTDGTLRAFDGRSGRVLWKVRPGAPMGGGATVAGGTVLIGYGIQFGSERVVRPPANSRGGIVAYTVP
jgi:polyvinyl alcohol dehydrogenase (cytochrome)